MTKGASPPLYALYLQSLAAWSPLENLPNESIWQEYCRDSHNMISFTKDF
jgi:hypothetical protein